MMGVTVRRLCPIFRTWTSVCLDLPTALLNKVVIILQFYILAKQGGHYFTVLYSSLINIIDF